MPKTKKIFEGAKKGATKGATFTFRNLDLS